MRICWDNLEDVYLSKRGNFRKNKVSYYLKICLYCNEEYLGQSTDKYCCKECTDNAIRKGKNHRLYGKYHTEETKKKISKKNKGKLKDKNNPMYGKKHTKEIKEKLSIFKKGKNNPNWKGGENVTCYNTYVKQLEPIEECKKTKEGYLQVKCKTCNKWFIPNRNQVKHKIKYLKGNSLYEGNFYCSNKCKNNCTIYRQHKYPKGFKKNLSREVQSELREMVLKRDEFQCIKCGNNNNLQCHHIEGINYNPLESSDTDLCITLCKECHKKIHSEEGCKYNELQCK